MSVICRTFVQNAWRSDLCSNCFKSLEDHTDGTARRNNVCEKLSMPRYVPQAATLYQSRGISTSLKWRLNESLYEKVSRRDFASQTPKTAKVSQQPEPSVPSSRGILIKTDTTSSEKKYKSRPSVDFASEEALVIGYGGNDYDSDTSPWEMGSDDGSIDFDLLDDTDEDRNITRLTKNNTEFNSFNKNLLSGDNTPNQVTKEEDKLNTINNNVNNQVKASDKSISILTYNDIQSTKADKKLNQYFFPSSTEIKSYLNGHGNTLILEDSVLKNNNEKSQITNNAKIQNCKRETEKKDNMNPKVVLNDDFTPLNTRTYSFVSELNKSSVNFEQSSDSDYSTCRHTPGDSTDSESFHDAEETRPLPKLSFLHGTYTVSSPQINELDIDKKYDAGSSTSGDVSNFSDDSDTHDCTDRTPYKLRNIRTPWVTIITENKINQKDVEQKVDLNERNEDVIAQNLHKQEEKSNQLYKKEERKMPNKLQKDSSPKTDSKKQQPTKTSPKSNYHISKLDDPIKVLTNKESSDISLVQNNKNASEKNFTSELEKGSLKYVTKENEFSTMVLKSASMPNIQSSNDVAEIKKSPPSKNKEAVKQELKPETYDVVSKSVKEEISSTSSSSSLRDTLCKDADYKQNSASGEMCEKNITESDDSQQQILKDRDFIDYEDHSDYEKSPEAINNRQSKLAALALELELARRDSESKTNKPPSPPAPIPPPEVKVRFSKTSAQINPASPSENLPTIKKASAISCASRLSSLPDVLQETPAKQKKTKFSLKKLLKRNKDSATFSPTSKEVNPKAWKKQTFDRNRLSLEIVHPMDLTSDVPTSAETTPTEEHRQIVSTNPGKFMFKGVSSRARSLSALPQLSSEEQSGCALLDCRKMDTVPMRKAGTVAERKKNRPALVRTPSCSALPNRSTSAGNSPAHYGNDRTPPPKPPPPPKCKVMHPPPPPPPPPPHSHPRATKTNSVSPARPPPPKVPENKSRSHSSGSSAQELREQNHSDKEYANLGDIRSLLTPKKPQRPSAFSASSRGDSEIGPKKSEDIYETLPATVEEEEDHYTYLDEAEMKASKSDPSKKAETAQKNKSSSSESIPCGRPWLDLQTSYAAIAAANYESLAELITTSLNESAEYFKKVEPSLKWRDFILDSKEQYNIVKEKAVYNAIYKNDSQDKVTLVVAPRKQTTPQNAKSQTRYPVLANFTDHVPKNFISTDNYILQESELASVYILQQSKITTVSNFAQMSSSDLANQHIHLRNYCFVLLQLIHTLKSLQAEGIEEINYDLQILVLVVTDEDKPPILVLFPEDKIHLTLNDLSNRKTLCQATLETMLHFLQINEIEDLKTCVVNGELLAEPVAHTFRAIAKVLSEEKASSLSQAKGFLEYMLWGPVDVKISQNESEEILDTILQRWLDLQRAQMVKSTISYLQNRKKLSESLHVYEEYQLIFLLQASAKSLKNVISKL